MMGSASLDIAYVSCGRLDAYIESMISLWDVAAGILLVESAGGRVDHSTRIRCRQIRHRGNQRPYPDRMIATGIGYDVHRLVTGRPLILGGVEIPHPLGLDGHSDADVLCHAIADALLGAAGEPDIGHLFPNTDQSIRGISSLEILRRVRALLDEKSIVIHNIDSTLIAEEPRISPYLANMKELVGAALNLPPARIGIKATTNETMGFLGRGEGMAAMATACVDRPL